MKIRMICTGTDFMMGRIDLTQRVQIRFQAEDQTSACNIQMPIDHDYRPGTVYTIEITEVPKPA
ncbi:MAG: hypothetical protein NVS9B4_01120 [Candidatus Acidiferrum sp.]